MSPIDDFRPNPISAAMTPEALASYRVTPAATLDGQHFDQNGQPHHTASEPPSDEVPAPNAPNTAQIAAAHTAAVVHSADGQSFTVNGTLFHLKAQQDPTAIAQGLTIDNHGKLPEFTPNPVKSPFSK